MQPRTFDLFEIKNIRDEVIQLCDVEYCDVLVDKIYNMLYPKRTMEEYPLIEEYDEEFDNYTHYVINKINEELIVNGLAFIELANSSGEDKTIIHRFILFNTISGVIRLDSYGKQYIYEFVSNKVIRKPGYALYKGRIVEWPSWKDDISMLLTMEPGDCRLCYWNGIFSAKEDTDTDEKIDVVLLI
jgi:hypothetical protein